MVIYSLLLLPQPRRELSKTPTSALTSLSRQQYTVYGIDVDLVSSNTKRAIFAPTNIWARSQGGILKVDFAERMAIISTLWSAANHHHNSGLAKLLVKHRNAALASNHEEICEAANEIRKKLNTNGDVLPLILREFNLPDYSSASYTGITDDTTGYDTEDSNVLPEDSARERIVKWRKQADRGPGARKFSIDVRNAYNYRCLFSGERFPKLDGLDSAGVDGAHILPWSSHELNSVSNGICLCKQCHWGFDNGLLNLSFDSSANAYVLSIPKNLEAIAAKENFDLAFFQKNAGVIDSSRFPKEHKLWPSPKYIEELNAKLPVTS